MAGVAASLRSVPFVGREREMSLVEAVESGDRATVLKVLACRIAEAIDSPKTRGPALPALCRQLLLIVRELEAL